MPWKPEYAEARRLRAQQDPEYRARRNSQSVTDPEARKAYMANYYEENPQKFRRTPEQQAKYNETRRRKYAENREYREAHKQSVKEWAQANPQKKRAQHVRQYGMTPECVDKMMEAQNGACAICQHSEKRHKLFPMIDHCHATGKVRGILCSRCNMAIGLMRDDPELMRKAIDYLLTRGSFGAS